VNNSRGRLLGVNNRPFAIESSKADMIFVNPTNGHRTEVTLPWLWTLLFGGFYFGVSTPIEFSSFRRLKIPHSCCSVLPT
jgi:hypothetical protein